MGMKGYILIAGLGLALAGCATRYQAMGFTGGYEEVQLAPDTYRINVEANGYSTSSRAEELALLRAADLTIQRGFSRFVVTGGTGVSQQFAGTTPITVNRVGNVVTAFGGDAITKPSGTIIIRMLGKNDPQFANGLDANLIAAQLRPKLT
jgi:hypothetical protein